MSSPRITLKGATLSACNRILNQTPIETYTELFKLLLMRYEREFIEATNGYLRQSPVTSHPDGVAPQPNKVIDKSLIKPEQLYPDKVMAQPSMGAEEEVKPQSDRAVQVDPQRSLSAKQMLMDFDD